MILITLGLIMLGSTSSSAVEVLGRPDPLYFVKRQAVFIIISIMVCVVAARIPYRYWKQYSLLLGAITLALLVMVITPGVGLAVKGSYRWLRVGPVNFQPSELAKIAVIVLMSAWLVRVQRKSDTFVRGLLVPLVILGLFAGLVFLEPDFGTTLLLGTVGMALMFMGGTRLSYLVIAGALGISGFVVAVMEDEVRMRRIIAFLDPEKYAENYAFQLLNAIYAFILGGGSGVGLGQSIQKKFYLPESHTDFIFAIIGEEFGLPGSLGVVVLYFLFFILGMSISKRSQDAFGSLMAFGLTTVISLQALINIGVVTGCLPTKGLALPFISYGGSHLVVSGLMLGMLINVGLHANRKAPPSRTRKKAGSWV